MLKKPGGKFADHGPFLGPRIILRLLHLVEILLILLVS